MILLHCVSAYPTDPKDSNLLVLSELESKFGVVGGLSDHTVGTATSIAAVALGASVIEKHVTLDRASGGIDSEFSIEPNELEALIRDARTAWLSLGAVRYGPSISEKESLKFRRSLYAVRDIGKDEPITNENVRSIRPSKGLAPKYLPKILGKCAVRNIKRGSPLSWGQLDQS
jgi:N-acetylneuraminate synthase